MSKRKLILAYICLVGVPLAGLLGILHAGQHLSSPVSLGGSWYLQANFAGLHNNACSDMLASVKQPFMSVSQSGADLALTINDPQKAVLQGTIRGTSLTASADDPQIAGGSAPCKNPSAIRLNATVDNQAGQRILTGKLAIDGCRDCTPVEFRAVQLSSHGRGGQ